MTRWDYVALIDPTDNELQRFGVDGWELVTVTPVVRDDPVNGVRFLTMTALYYHLKRPVEEL